MCNADGKNWKMKLHARKVMCAPMLINAPPILWKVIMARWLVGDKQYTYYGRCCAEQISSMDKYSDGQPNRSQFVIAIEIVIRFNSVE